MTLKEFNVTTLSDDLLLEAADLETLEKLVRLISLPTVDGKVPEKPYSLLSLMSSVAKFGEAASDSGEKITHFVGYEINFDHPHQAHSIEALSGALHLGALGFTAVNFFRTPAEYVNALVSGKKINPTVSKNARWALSAVMLAIGILVACFPVIAPGFSIGAAFLGLGAGVIGMASLLYQRLEIEEQQVQVKKAIAMQEQLITDINAHLLPQYYLLEEALAEKDKSKCTELIGDMRPLLKKLEAAKRGLIHLKNHQAYLEQTFRKLNSTAMLDKIVSISLSVIVIIGITISYMLPPVGLAIIAGVAAAGFLYVTARFGIPLLKQLGSWITRQFNSTKETTVDEQNESGAQFGLAMQPLDERDSAEVDKPEQDGGKHEIKFFSDNKPRQTQNQLGDEDAITTELLSSPTCSNGFRPSTE
ncbi:hypothetical protein [Legionella yabuuchiae]|uniref:hypothetical protein n=1 Tax=Legionella yabuuchiae TaxID=376727 RepID=UPI00105574BF|nr:hypothetical protein [Legionella yabuuchiae]